MKVESQETDFKRKSKLLLREWSKYKIEYKIIYMWYIFEKHTIKRISTPSVSKKYKYLIQHEF